MSWFTITLFFVYTLGLGYTASFFVTQPKDLIERYVMRIGYGLALFGVVGVFLNLLSIPLDWKIFLGLSVIPAVGIYFWKHKKLVLPQFRLTKDVLAFLPVLLIFIVYFYMHLSGSYAYTYLENDDPWDHAMSLNYIRLEKTAYEPEGIQRFHYIDPYPPAYNILLGTLFQTTDSVVWIMRFFNSLIIGLGLLFFYFFVKQFTSRTSLAILATLILASLPNFLSHFIWALTLIVNLFFPLMYTISKAMEEKKFAIITSIVFAGMLVTQISMVFKLGLMAGIYWVVRCWYDKKIHWNVAFAIIAAGLIASAWYIPVLSQQDSLTDDLPGIKNPLSGKYGETIFKFPGTGDREYNAREFFLPALGNMINNPIGVGFFVMMILLITLLLFSLNYRVLFKTPNAWILTVVIWLIVNFIGIHGARLPVQFIAFRYWMLFAIPVSLLVAYGVLQLSKLKGTGFWIVLGGAELLLIWFNYLSTNLNIQAGGPQFYVLPWPVALFAVPVIFGLAYLIVPKLRSTLPFPITVRTVTIILVFILMLYAGSMVPKWEVNTASWYSNINFANGVPVREQLQGYVQLNQFPKLTPIFGLTQSSDSWILGYDHYNCAWCKDELDFKKTAINKTPQEVHSFVQSKGYEYILIDPTALLTYGVNDTTRFIQSSLESGLYQPAYQLNGFMVLKLV